MTTLPDLSIENLFSVKGKKVVVTGGTKGIGLMISAGFVQNGADVYMFSRKPDQEVAKLLTSKGPGKAFSFACDVMDEKSILQVRDEIAKLEPNGIHCLVNNAGATWGDPFDKTPKSSFDKVLGVNVTGLFMVSQAFGKLLEKPATAERPSSIINIASVDGIRVPAIEEYAYSASKAGVIHLTRVMSGYLAPRNITVNTISPGLFPSKMGSQVIAVMGDGLGKMIPLGRAGEPKDIASACIFYAGYGGAFTTGSNVIIDGGTTVSSANPTVFDNRKEIDRSKL